jgi:hypothetical protein
LSAQPVSLYANHVVLRRELVEGLAERTQKRNRLIRQLNDKVMSERMLLRSALHELALARDPDCDPQRFIKEWERAHRVIRTTWEDEA